MEDKTCRNCDNAIVTTEWSTIGHGKYYSVDWIQKNKKYYCYKVLHQLWKYHVHFASIQNHGILQKCGDQQDFQFLQFS